MNKTFEKIVGEEYQIIAATTDDAFSRLLLSAHEIVHEGEGGDGVRTMLIGMIDDMLPQARKDADAIKAMAFKTAGNA